MKSVRIFVYYIYAERITYTTLPCDGMQISASCMENVTPQFAHSRQMGSDPSRQQLVENCCSSPVIRQNVAIVT
jgi:hypothetical protein